MVKNDSVKYRLRNVESHSFDTQRNLAIVFAGNFKITRSNGICLNITPSLRGRDASRKP